MLNAHCINMHAVQIDFMPAISNKELWFHLLGLAWCLHYVCISTAMTEHELQTKKELIV